MSETGRSGYDGSVTQVNMRDARRSLTHLVKRAAAGEDIVIANHGKPVAMITQLPKVRAKLPWNVFKGKIEIAKDFDSPLPEFKTHL